MGRKPQQRFYVMALLAVIGVVTVGTIRPQPISSLIEKEKFWSTKVHSKKKYDVIVAGDSRVYRGIDPESISKELDGLDVLNFGFSSGGHNDAIFNEIEKRLQTDAPKKAVVLGLTPYSLTKKAQGNEHFNQEKERAPKEIFLRRFVNPTLGFFDPIKPTDLIYANDTTLGYYERFRPNGWVESKKLPYDSTAALKSYVKNFKDNKLDEKVFARVLSKVNNWTNQGIQVFAVRMPTTKAMEVLENDLADYSEKDLKELFEKAGGHWLGYENRFRYTTFDGSHLDGEASKKFSTYLGKELGRYLK